MKRIVVVWMFILSISMYSQNQGYRGRIGINTDTPKATLDISRKDLSSLPTGQSQGVLFPKFTTNERNIFQNVEPGTMIYNTDKKCVEMCISSSGGVCKWKCIMSQVPPLAFTLLDVEVLVASLKHSNANYQGKINNTDSKIKVKIPYRDGVGSHKSITIETMAVAGQDGKKKKLVLKIPEGNFDTSGSGILEGEIEVADGSEYLIELLDAGFDKSIAEFVIRTKSGVSKVSLKATGGILDRCYNKTTRQCWGYGSSRKKEHQFVYFPIEGPDGKIWLSQNLGAKYSDITSSDFNPSKQTTSVKDHKAYGSLFQWQRPSDGHELINWSSSSRGRKGNTSSTLSTNPDWKANDDNFITNSLSPNSWVNTTVNSSSSNKNLWQRGGSNNPCPEGFHVPTKSELIALNKALTSNGNKLWNHSTLVLPAVGNRFDSSGDLFRSGEDGYYWSSEENGNESWSLIFDKNSSNLANGNRANGRSVRCIKD